MTLLAEGNDTDLSNLALDLGFYDHAHLSSEFKRSTLTTPSEFSASLRYREYNVVAATPTSA
jgi:AraC-like DNA-binding protein